MYYITKFCLLCLKEDDGSFRNVENKDSNGVSIEEKLDYCVFELVSSGHEFPGYLCKECLDLVDMFYSFKQKCFRNNRKIRNFMDSLKQMHFAKISFRDLSVSIEDIKDQISFPLKQKSADLNKSLTHKMKNLKSETSKMNKTTGMFQCEECPKQFFVKSKLTRHAAIHSAPKFECCICQKKFSRKDTMKAHERVHDKLNNKLSIKKQKAEEESYECGICLKKIAHKYNMKRHFIKFHADKENNLNSSPNITNNTKLNLSVDNFIDLTDDESNISNISTTSDVVIILDEDEIIDLRGGLKKIVHKEEKDKLENGFVKNNIKGSNNLQCFVCDKTFTRHCKLTTHVNTHFADNAPYKA